MPRSHLVLLLCSLAVFTVAPVGAAPPSEAPNEAAKDPDPKPQQPPPADEKRPAPERDDAPKPRTEPDEQPTPDSGEAAPPAEDAAGTDAEQPPASAAPDPTQTRNLQQKVRELRDAIFEARARVSVVASKLFQSTITLEVRSNLQRFYEVREFAITIDGAPVYQAESGTVPNRTPLFEVFAAPGSHRIGVAAELVARRDSTYTVGLHQTFGIVVPERSTVFTKLVLRETGNMWRFGKRGRGQYRLRIKLRAKAKKRKSAPSTRQ